MHYTDIHTIICIDGRFGNLLETNYVNIKVTSLFI
jgi:hypothetical protein